MPPSRLKIARANLRSRVIARYLGQQRVNAMASNARVRQIVKNMGETKFMSEQRTGLGSVAGTITRICDVAQGAANGQRVGLDIRHLNLSLKYAIQNTDTSVQRARVIIFKWFDDYNSAPLIGQILKNDTGGANPSTLAPYNLLYKDKYKILHSRVYDLAGYNAAAGDKYAYVDSLKHCSTNIRLKGKAKYLDDLASHFEKGVIYVAVITTSANVTSPDFSYLYKYKDD